LCENFLILKSVPPPLTRGRGHLPPSFLSLRDFLFPVRDFFVVTQGPEFSVFPQHVDFCGPPFFYSGQETFFLIPGPVSVVVLGPLAEYGFPNFFFSCSFSPPPQSPPLAGSLKPPQKFFSDESEAQRAPPFVLRDC